MTTRKTFLFVAAFAFAVSFAEAADKGHADAMDFAGPLADLDNDGIGALFEYAFASDLPTANLRSVEVRDVYLLTDPAHPRRFMRLQLTQP